MTAKDQSNPVGFSEADTCREYVTPGIQAAGWGDSPFEFAEQRFFTDGRTSKRREGKRADYGAIGGVNNFYEYLNSNQPSL